MKDVHDDIPVVRDNPLAERESVRAERRALVFGFQPGFEFVHDGLELRLRGAGADDEEVRERRELAKIDRDDVFRFFVGYDAGAEPGEFV